MAFCKSCGAELAPDVKFCEKCGSQVAASVPAPPYAPAQDTPGEIPKWQVFVPYVCFVASFFFIPEGWDILVAIVGLVFAIKNYNTRKAGRDVVVLVLYAIYVAIFCIAYIILAAYS